jgi:hypothetical protein
MVPMPVGGPLSVSQPMQMALSMPPPPSAAARAPTPSGPLRYSPPITAPSLPPLQPPPPSSAPGMGAAVIVPVDEKSLPARGSTADQVGRWLAGLAPACQPYYKAAIDNNLDGDMLHSIAAESNFAAAAELLQCAGITNKIHQKLILLRLTGRSK